MLGPVPFSLPARPDGEICYALGGGQAQPRRPASSGDAGVEFASSGVGMLRRDEGLDQSLQAAHLGDEDGQLAAKFDDVFARPEGTVSYRGGMVPVVVRSK